MFKVRRAAFEDYYNVLDLADDQLGAGYLKGVLKLTSDRPLWIAEKSDTNELIGFVFVISNHSKTIIKSVAIKKQYQAIGVGTRLFKVVLSQLSPFTNEFEVFAWERSDSKVVPLEKLLNKLGFVRSYRVSKAWYDDSIRRGYKCPSCAHPCSCDAVVFNSPSSGFAANID